MFRTTHEPQHPQFESGCGPFLLVVSHLCLSSFPVISRLLISNKAIIIIIMTWKLYWIIKTQFAPSQTLKVTFFATLKDSAWCIISSSCWVFFQFSFHLLGISGSIFWGVVYRKLWWTSVQQETQRGLHVWGHKIRVNICCKPICSFTKQPGSFYGSNCKTQNSLYYRLLKTQHKSLQEITFPSVTKEVWLKMKYCFKGNNTSIEDG